MNSRNEHTRPHGRRNAEASYDEASRARASLRASRPGGSGSGGDERGLKVVRAGFLAICAGIVGRLAWLHLVDGSRLAALAESQRTNKLTLHAKRGTIYDRNGNVLAMSVDCETVYANPSVVEDPSGVAAVLATHLGGDKSDYMDLLTQDGTFVYVKQRVDQSVADELSAELTEKGLSGIYFLSDVKRVYPYGTVAQQVLGFVGGDDGQTGISGLELQYNDILTGTDGEMLVETAEGGSPIAGGASEITEAVDGTDLIISLDVDIQQAAEEAIAAGVETYSSDSGSVMVLEPKTGEILAACSTPLADFDNLTDNAMLQLKLVSSSFEPGSVFKVITTSIGFEAGLFDTETTYHVPQQILVGEDYVNDSPPLESDTYMTVRYMLQHSSNVAMAMLVQQVIGAETFSEGVARFGIGTKTGIDFPGEAEGIVKTLNQYDGSTAGSMAFGQGLAVPMVQIVKAFATVANDGVPMTPHFLVMKGDEEVDWPAGARVISEETAAKEKDIMRSVMDEDGTGESGDVAGYDVAGKTGTGEQASAEGGYGAYDYVASLCGFANASDPDVLVYAGLNGTSYLAYSSSSAIFHDVMQQSLGIMGVMPTE